MTATGLRALIARHRISAEALAAALGVSIRRFGNEGKPIDPATALKVRTFAATVN